MELYDKIFESNKKWVAENKAKDNEFFEHLSEGQSPEILYMYQVSCESNNI